MASDMIAREVALLSQGGVPVVAAIGDVGASGGYYIAGARGLGWAGRCACARCACHLACAVALCASCCDCHARCVL